MFRSLFLFLLLSVSAQAQSPSLSQLIEKARSIHLADDLQWGRLLHIEKTRFGGVVSQVDDEKFFLDKSADWTPAGELEATLKGLFEAWPVNLDDAMACRYPARAAYLLMKLGGGWKQPNCPKFTIFFSDLRGPSVSLVFSSYYLNNPSSAFGHTFLRLNKGPTNEGRRHELLDNGLNYAATVDTNNALVYGIKGMFGLFHGEFTSVPYYYKVREYNNAESRDLWEYELDLTQDEVDLLVAHAWEMGHTYIDYWYLSENCSYHMMSLLEAATPRFDLTSRLKSGVLPADTVKIAWQTPGLVRSFHFRPSIRTEFFERLNWLSQEEQDVLADLVLERKGLQVLDSRDQESQRKILDTALDFMDFRFAHDIQKDGPQEPFKDQLFIARGKLPLVSPSLGIAPAAKDFPHEGHGSRRWLFGATKPEFSPGRLTLGLRNALHGQTDLLIGYPEYAETIFGNFEFSTTEKENRVDLEEFTVFEILSMTPLHRFASTPSWRIRLGVQNEVSSDGTRLLGSALSGGLGATWAGGPLQSVSFFGGARALVFAGEGSYEHRNFAAGGLNLRSRFRWDEDLITVAELWWKTAKTIKHLPERDHRIWTQWSPSPDWALRATLGQNDFEGEASVDLLLFR